MHEYSIVQSLVDSVAGVVAKNGGGAVHHVSIEIGELSGVDTDLLQTAYDTFREGTLCERAPLTIKRTPARWECRKCAASIARGAILRCPVCDAPARMVSGDEIMLRRVELEVA
jgi:hydrogenase nickel incorporation protein HypA/HybF